MKNDYSSDNGLKLGKIYFVYVHILVMHNIYI
jgi:hypothetical protein